MDLTSLPGLATLQVPGNIVFQVPTMECGGNIQLHPMQWKPYFSRTKTETGMNTLLSHPPCPEIFLNHKFQLFVVTKGQN
jgi:hypothetical protein